MTPVNDAPRLVQGLPDLTVLEDAIIPPLMLSPTYFFDPDVALNGDVLTFEVVGNTNPLLVTPIISGNQLLLTLSSNRSGFSDIRDCGQGLQRSNGHRSVPLDGHRCQ